jgi:uncharacterized protein (TIGR02145 family)
MKKECKRIPLWKCKGLLSAALSIFTVVAHAQSAEVCSGTAYTILSTVDASSAATYQWLENGQIIPGASAATYTVPSNKAAGLYTYIRQAKSADCSTWQQSNEFVVTVFACSFTAGTATSATAIFTDPRDGKNYKTVVMPDNRTWFAQNLNYTKGLTYNAYSYEANGKQFTTTKNGISAIGSYWCPGANGTALGSEADCRMYGALYTWETAMMVDGKYADESKTSSAWDESWVSPYYVGGTPLASASHPDKNNARGGTNAKDGGRGICPKGWHIPTFSEWANMLNKIDGSGTGTAFNNQAINQSAGVDASQKLRSASTCTTADPIPGAWLNPTCPGSDLYGFNIVPSGVITDSRKTFYEMGTRTLLFCSTVASDHQALQYEFTGACNVARRYFNRQSALTVRCIADN